QESYKQTQLNFPPPAEPHPSASRVRELRKAWQEAYPSLPPDKVQLLAFLGYEPSQWSALHSYLSSEDMWKKWQQELSIHQAVQRAKEAADKLYERVQSIRMYVRRIEDVPLQKVSLQESLSTTISFYKPLMRKIEVSLEMPEETLYVTASPARLEQVWANLIQNAIQAMPEGGKLQIRLAAIEGHKAQVLIQDSGKGIPPALKEAIFEPLFTTKAPGEGTGLGLPLCRQIIEGYGGTLRLLHSEPGCTLFGVELPLTARAEKA
ncbi:MAG: HAMP domain-containing sensor histidine kinase, partial [Bacteroidia bacterium]|nr:HAMP domain-containing histidine kinase [Bacteroidia bacterium]MDW8134755.1 HAMP domain-containing sensor histidine kinase [Bacteroidia bacterium]